MGKLGFFVFMNIKDIKPHPAADAFPMMDAKRFEELKEDIKSKGLQVPIVLCDGMILDGRNRYKACSEIGIEPSVKQYNGDPWSFVWSLNGTRRDLVAEQRYLIWKHCHEQSEEYQAEKRRIEVEANRKRSEAAKAQENRANQYTEPKEKVQVRDHNDHAPAKKERKSEQPQRSVKITASKTNVGAVARGDQLYKERPDLAKKVMSGDMKPAEAHRLMKKDEVAKNVEETKKHFEKQECTAFDKFQDIVDLNIKFATIYADPPWRYNNQATRAATDNHYDGTMSVEELCKMPIKNITAEKAHLHLWVTNAFLFEVPKILEAWGFEYKSTFVWVKPQMGIGNYWRNSHELMILAVKGGLTAIDKSQMSWVECKRGKHSAKPLQVRERIEKLSPGPRLELFGRKVVEGWFVFGNQIQNEMI